MRNLTNPDYHKIIFCQAIIQENLTTAETVLQNGFVTVRFQE